MSEEKRRNIDELLELLYVAKEDGIIIKTDNIPSQLPCFDAGVEFKNMNFEEVIKSASEGNLIKVGLDGVINLTDVGLRKATNIVRKHRIAERLLLDILELKEVLLEKNACIFEHHLSMVVTDKICTILNHPPVCPHNKAIPRGVCCQNQVDKIEPAVIPLKNANMNIEYKVLFTKGFDNKTFLMLKSFGIFPGVQIKVLQKSPEMVLEIENSKIAVERAIADRIFVLPLSDKEVI